MSDATDGLTGLFPLVVVGGLVGMMGKKMYDYGTKESKKRERKRKFQEQHRKVFFGSSKYKPL